MGSSKASNKRARRELAIKQAKKKKIIIISVISVIIISLASYFIISAILSSGTEVFTDGTQTVSFQSNGKFTATLTHGISYRGTYAISEQDEGTNVSFTVNGFSIYGDIVDEHLILPAEWQDTCGHNFILPKR